MLTLASVALIMPALFHHLVGASRAERTLSLEISVVLIATYLLLLLFSLHTHKQLFTRTAAQAAQVEDEGRVSWSLARSLGTLVGAAALIGWVSEVLVGSVEAAAETLGMTEVFVGVIVVAIVGNAAEHSTAILMAWKNRMDLAVGIAVGSSVQIALFVAPVLVLLSFVVGPDPMALVFNGYELGALLFAVLIANLVTQDGESNWFEGVQLLALYAVLGLVFYFA
jgi:Ca2+:H+ antiporter